MLSLHYSGDTDNSGSNGQLHILTLFSWVQSELEINMTECEEMQIVVEGDDSSFISPYTESEDKALRLQCFST